MDLAVPANKCKSIEVDVESLQFLADDMKYSLKREPQEETYNTDADKLRSIDAVGAQYESLLNGRGKLEIATVPPLHIDLVDDQKIAGLLLQVKNSRLSPMQKEIIRAHIKDLLDKDYITQSQSSVSSRTVLVHKKNGDYRLCVICIDYRDINRCTKPMRLPLPNGKDVLQRLRDTKFFGRMDLRKGFRQI